jgi:hypothetical protein
LPANAPEHAQLIVYDHGPEPFLFSPTPSPTHMDHFLLNTNTIEELVLPATITIHARIDELSPLGSGFANDGPQKIVIFEQMSGKEVWQVLH